MVLPVISQVIDSRNGALSYRNVNSRVTGSSIHQASRDPGAPHDIAYSADVLDCGIEISFRIDRTRSSDQSD